MVQCASPESGCEFPTNCLNGQRGPSILDLGNGYSADRYFKDSYTSNISALIQKTEELIVRAKLWTPDVAHAMVIRGVKGDPQNTSWIGFRKTAASEGDYDGLAWQEEVHIPTPINPRGHQLLWMKLRVFIEEAQGHHLGRAAMQSALYTHPNAEYIGHRSGNPLAVRSFLESGVFMKGRRFPYDCPFDSDPELLHLLLWTYSSFRTQGKSPDLATGVSIGDYLEPNGAIPLEIHGSAKQIFEWMVGEKTEFVIIDEERKRSLGMNLKRGDSLIEIGQLK